MIPLVAVVMLWIIGSMLPAEGEYGSDPTLDRLYNECAEGDGAACADLFWESPVDSEYERFALEQGSR